MKKSLTLLLAILLLVACSDKGDTTKDTGEENNETAIQQDESKNNTTETEEQKKVYQMRETAKITSDLYDFDYEVTVNDFDIQNEVDSVKIQDYITGADEGYGFAVVDVTIKNISDESYVPNEMFSANLAKEGDTAGDISNDEFFEVGDKELAPGDELKGHLVYDIPLDDSRKYTLKYEISSDEEIHFVLPNPKK
ncbi:DUF4352 domain-containing protein [Virgibacillus sp. M23]|uniref:DUF4352 domain-containing protein n=1 Tax=Virgibacillus sp. M23 TaxID=3079030 RepID=UPI002A91FE1D|nr:DUF4352 domain-containing protein [Virgibacillus sp. M23]MDY7045180.1 DUF4352 domain-containing protein [Virgibacillus sp. M23]